MATHFKSLIILLVTVGCVVLMFLQPPIPQDQEYHHFADTRTIVWIHNFWNVVSNIPFFVLGIVGLYSADVFKNPFEKSSMPYMMICIGVTGIGLGSGYYHYAPSNLTLVWDRVPMTITFMSFFSIVISRYVNYRTGIFLLFPLLLLGVSSVLVWYLGEQHGTGDLRLYALVQFYPMLVIPLIIFIYPTSRHTKIELLSLIFVYVIAKVFEKYDDDIYNAGNLISGHSLKHFFAAGSIFIMLRMNKPVHLG